MLSFCLMGSMRRQRRLPPPQSPRPSESASHTETAAAAAASPAVAPMGYFYGALHPRAANELMMYTSPKRLDPMQQAFVQAYTNLAVLGRWLTQQYVAATTYRQHTQQRLDRDTDTRWIPPLPPGLTLFQLSDNRWSWHVQDALRDNPNAIHAVWGAPVGAPVGAPPHGASAPTASCVYALDANLSRLTPPETCEVVFARDSHWIQDKPLFSVATHLFGSDHIVWVTHSHAYSSPAPHAHTPCMMCALAPDAF